jgi:hypothetical protein
MALANPKQVELLAEGLTRCADSIHNRIMKAIAKKEMDRITAQTLFQDESALRQRANALTIDAVDCVVKDLALPQKTLMGAVRTAETQMKAIKEVANCIDLAADLLSLAAAAYAAKPGPILAAWTEIREDFEALKQN